MVLIYFFLVVFSICSCIVFLILLSCVFVFSFSLLGIFKRVLKFFIWKLRDLRFFMVCFWSSVLFLWLSLFLCMLCDLVLIWAFEKKKSPSWFYAWFRASEDLHQSALLVVLGPLFYGCVFSGLACAFNCLNFQRGLPTSSQEPIISFSLWHRPVEVQIYAAQIYCSTHIYFPWFPNYATVFVRRNRNQSCSQPNRLKCWTHSPLVFQHQRWSHGVGLFPPDCTMLCWKGHRHSKFQKLSYPFGWSLFLVTCWPGCCSFSTGL